MHTAVLAYYSLGSASIISTGAVTVLDGICYSTFKPSSPGSPAFELAIVGLHGMCCVGLVILAVLLGRDIKSGPPQNTRWKAGIYCSIGAFLFIATAVTAGTTAWRSTQSTMDQSQALLIAQCTMWAVSIFNQGLFCGFLLITLTKQGHCNEWGCSLPQDPETVQDSPCAKAKRGPILPSLDQGPQLQLPSRNSAAGQDGFAPVRSFAVSMASRASNRYSGRTLFQRDSAHSSFDSVSPESPSIRIRPDVQQYTSYDRGSHKWKPQRPHSEIKRSLDSLVLQPSPITSPTNAEPTKPGSTKSNASEHHIHPLFRSGSISPPPMPGPGTTVTASPVAGQTISVQMLNRVRSANSVYVNGTRNQSRLVDRVNSMENFLQDPELSDRVSSMAGCISTMDGRRSGSLHERKHELKRHG